MRVILLVALGGLFAWPLPAQGALTLDARFGFTDGEFTLRLDDGRVVSGEALAGLTVQVKASGEDLEIRFDGIDQRVDLVGTPVLLYRLSVRSGRDLPFRSLCQRDAQGREAALAILDAEGKVGFTCTSGAEGKCILLGYRPSAKKGGISLRDVHLACIRMLRADYGGDDVSHTRDGTLVAFRDSFGLHDYPADNQMPFEAAWGPDGAVCVARPRIGALTTLEQLADRYPALAGRLGSEACREDTEPRNPRALLFNRSKLQSPER